jgi:hypothetical protein
MPQVQVAPRAFGRGLFQWETELAVVVVSLAAFDLSADLAARRAGGVDVDVSRSFTECLHDFCKVRGRRNALSVGSNYIGRRDGARDGARSGVWASRRVWKAGRRTTSSARGRTAEKYHDSRGLPGKAEMDVREKDLSVQVTVGDCVAEHAAIRAEGGVERSGCLSCDRRNFVQATKTSSKADNVVGSCRRDAEYRDKEQ